MENAIATAKRDDQLERLCDPTDPQRLDLDAGTVIKSDAFQLIRFDTDPITLHSVLSQEAEADEPELEQTSWLVGAYFEGVSILPAPPQVIAAWRRLEEGMVEVPELLALLDAGDGQQSGTWPATGKEWLSELIEAGAIGLLDRRGQAPAD